MNFSLQPKTRNLNKTESLHLARSPYAQCTAGKVEIALHRRNKHAPHIHILPYRSAYIRMTTARAESFCFSHLRAHHHHHITSHCPRHSTAQSTDYGRADDVIISNSNGDLHIFVVNFLSLLSHPVYVMQVLISHLLSVVSLNSPHNA